MPNIIINEVDETTVQEGTSLLTDIVFIPGLADTNENVYVLSGADQTPEGLELQGTGWMEGDTFQRQVNTEDNDHKFKPYYKFDDSSGNFDKKVTIEYPTFAINIVTKKVWVWYSSGILNHFELDRDQLNVNTSGWNMIIPNSSTVLLPENSFSLCRSVAEFKNKFGSEPTRFSVAQGYPTTPTGVTMDGDKLYFAGDMDRSYIMAYECLKRGLAVLYYNVVERKDKGQKKEDSSDDTKSSWIYKVLNKESDQTFADPSIFDQMEDKNQISVKYLTSGGYPTFEISAGENDDYTNCTNNMVELAKARGDCVAIIDHFRNPIRPFTGESSVIGSTYLKSIATEKTGEFCTMFTPWAQYSSSFGTTLQAGSFGYLTALAESIQSYPNFLAVAGTARGQLTNLIALDTFNVMPYKVVNNIYQSRDKISINPITEITPYGWTIWGNRTLFDNSKRKNLVARSFLNIRNLVSDIKKQAYVTAKRLMFEQDSDVLWLRFKMGLTPLLDSMKTSNGLSDYRVIRATAKYDGSPLNKGEIAAIIRIFPKYAIEDWEISVVISDEEVSVD